MVKWPNGHAVILGCSSGVGAAIAKQMASLGLGVFGVHRGNHLEEAEATHKAIRDMGVPVQFVVADAGATYATARDAFELLTASLPPQNVRVLVHSLSGASIGAAHRMQPEKVERTFNQLAHSFVWWTRWLKDEYFEPGARVIALSNPCPDFYLRSSGVVGPAKAALEAYVRVLAAELKGEPTVNCLRFSTVVTTALEKVMPTAIERLTLLHKEIVPAGRIQLPQDVADLVMMLVSPEARWLNGAIIDGTGGAPMMLMNYAFHGTR